MKTKQAFTLAEVLITLAIIGIIAAITIPSIVANHQKRTLETQFTKAYRTISTAVNLAIADHGDISTWEWEKVSSSSSRDEFVKKYFMPYLNVVKFCPHGSGAQGCFPNAIYKYFNGNDWAKLQVTSMLLADGMVLATSLTNDGDGKVPSLIIDINGANNPNTAAKDTYVFNFFPNTGEFLPKGVNKLGTYDEEKNAYEKYSKEEIIANCSIAHDGTNCAARIVSEGFKINY